MFESIKRSFREHMIERNAKPEDTTTYHKETTPRSSRKSNQNVAENSQVVRRSSTTTPQSHRGTPGKVKKRRSSRNLSRTRLDMMAVAAQTQITRSKLPTVEEYGSKTINSNTPKELLSPTPHYDLERSNDQASRDALLEMSVPELIQTVLDLRRENSTLKLQPISVEEQFLSENAAAKDSAQWQQQRKALEDTRSQLAMIQEDLSREKARAKEAERSRNRMMKQLALATKLEATFYDDGHFKEAAQQLRYQVYNWVKNRRWEVVNCNQSRNRHQNVRKLYGFLRTTCPEYDDYIGSRKGVELLVQGHIWQYFGRHVFCRSFWAETREKTQAEKDLNHNPFSTLQTHLKQDVAPRHEVQYQEWRVASVRLLALRDPKIVDANIAHTTKKILSPLSEDLTAIMSGNMKLSSLENIFRSAIHLDYLIQQQRPHYKFYPVLPETMTGPIPFDEEKINAPDEDVEFEKLRYPLTVKLVVEPALCKFGNSEGKNYEAETCLLKAEVEFMNENKR